MSLYAGKQMLFIVSQLTPSLTSLKEVLEQAGVIVEVVDFTSITREFLKKKFPNLIVIQTANAEEGSTTVLNTLRESHLSKKIPTICLVEDNQDEIQSVLTLGASDYFFENESIDSIETKVQVLLGQSNNFEGATVIDIPNDHANIDKTGVRVYVVEDDPLLRNLLSTRFEQSSFPFEFSTDGKKAVMAMKQFKPQVIILDLMLPGKSGLDLLAEIKDDEQLSSIPVIIFSNRDEGVDRQRAEELGAKKFYVKALTNLSELVEEISRLS